MEAFVLLGQARFGDAWNWEEWAARRPPGERPQPPEEPEPFSSVDVKQPDGTTRHIERPVRRVAKGRFEWVPYKEAIADFEANREVLERAWEERCAAHTRFVETWNELRVLLHSEHIGAVAWDKKYGNETAIPAYVWASERALKALESGIVSFSSGYSGTSTSGSVLVSEKDLRRHLDESEQQQNSAPIDDVTDEEAESNPRSTTASKIMSGGRPAKWDWESCWLEICRIAHNEGLPETQAALVRRLQDWFISQYSDTPAESEIKKRVRRVFYALREDENP